MLDPRIAIMDMIHGVREQLNQIEMQLWDLPHNEPVAEYEEVFVAPVTGDYLHPSTPTHPCPEDLGSGAYWDECCQAWMVANDHAWDYNNISTNYNTDMSFLPNSGNVWVAESADDWSNNYANDWYVAPSEILEEYITQPVDSAPYEHRMPVEPVVAPVVDPGTIIDPASALTNDAAVLDVPMAELETEAHQMNDSLAPTEQDEDTMQDTMTPTTMLSDPEDHPNA